MTAENLKGRGLDSSIFSLPTQEINYKGLLKKYFLDKWYLYLICLGLGLFLARTYINLIEPIYEVKSKLLITEGETDRPPSEDWIRNTINFSSVSENVNNEIQLLTSYALLHKVVTYLNLDINYFWKEGMSKRTAYHDFPVVVKSYELSSGEHLGAPFRIQPLDNQAFNMFDEDDNLIGTYQFDQPFSNAYGTFCMEVDGLLPTSDRQMFVQFMDLAAVAERYLNDLAVEFVDVNSTTLRVAVYDPVPARGVDILENVIVRYEQMKNYENNRIANSTLQFIDDRLIDIGQDLRSVENSVESYKLNNNIAAETTSDLQITLQKVSDLDQEKDRLEVQLNMLESMKSSLNMSNTEFDLIPVNSTSANIQIQEIVRPYNDLVLERRKLLSTSQPSNPLVQSINQRLISLKNSIYAAIEGLQSDLQLQVQRVGEQYQQSVTRLRSVPRNERILTDKSREKGIIEELYVYLLQKREETALSLIGISSNLMIIDPPRSSLKPVAPNPLLYYFGGSLAGFAIPFLMISFLEILRDSVQSEEEVKEVIPNHPIMGMINQDKDKRKRQHLVIGGKQTFTSDRFRSLRTNMQFLSKGQVRSILVTSSVSQEGKSFVAVNLAGSFAAAGDRTVIVDFDLRNPSVASYLGMPKENVTGLSSYFNGETDKIEDMIRESNTPNLFYLGSGPIPKRPEDAVIPEGKVTELFAYLQANFDTIIVDTSPVGIITDAILLNKHVSFSLFVVRIGKTTKDMLEKAREIFDQDLLVNPMLVLNGLKKGQVYGYRTR